MATVQVTSAMADNNTLVQAPTESYDAAKLLRKYLFITLYIIFALTIATLIYGVTSWCMIKKFRNYKNYVFLNAILISFFLFLKTTFYTYVADNPLIDLDRYFLQFFMITMFLTTYLSTVKLYWLIVICHMFYVDFVKVFNGYGQRRFLKSGLFGWVASLFTSLVYIFVIDAVINSNSDLGGVVFYVSILPMVLNGLLYIITVCTLFSSSNSDASAHATSKWRRLYIATFIFVLSEVYIFLYNGLWYTNPSAITSFLENAIGLFVSTILNVYLVVDKRNRELWHEFYVNKLNERKRNLDIKMDVKPAKCDSDSGMKGSVPS